jgi:hypothetical protein
MHVLGREQMNAPFSQKRAGQVIGFRARKAIWLDNTASSPVSSAPAEIIADGC